MLLALDAVNRDEGTVVVFEGFDPSNPAPNRYLVAVDHRMARDLAAAIDEGAAPVCEVEPWQIVGRIASRSDLI